MSFPTIPCRRCTVCNAIFRYATSPPPSFLIIPIIFTAAGAFSIRYMLPFPRWTPSSKYNVIPYSCSHFFARPTFRLIVDIRLVRAMQRAGEGSHGDLVVAADVFVSVRFSLKLASVPYRITSRSIFARLYMEHRLYLTITRRFCVFLPCAWSLLYHSVGAIGV